MKRCVAPFVLLVALGCGSTQTKQVVRSTETIKELMPDGSHELTWVLVERVSETQEVVVRFGTDKLGKDTVKSVSEPIPVSRQETLSLWLCYRVPDRSKPQCYEAEWNEADDGPKHLIRDRRGVEPAPGRPAVDPIQ